MAKLTYNGKKEKRRFQGLVRAVQERGYKFAFVYKGDMTVAVMASRFGTPDLNKKIFSRGIAKCNTDVDTHTPVVGRYYALRRAFEALLRKRNGDHVNEDNTNMRGLMFKSQYRVNLRPAELSLMKKKLAKA